eukprot:9731860-Alexandrium_andersonii.AAC.1
MQPVPEHAPPSPPSPYPSAFSIVYVGHVAIERGNREATIQALGVLIADVMRQAAFEDYVWGTPTIGIRILGTVTGAHFQPGL